MESGIKKCGEKKKKVMKEGKRCHLKQQRQLMVRGLQKIKKWIKYPDILEYNIIMASEMKEDFRKEYLKRTKLIVKSTLNCRNKVMAMNTQIVCLMGTNGADIVKWTNNELDEIDRKTRKLMIMIKELYPKPDVDRLRIFRTKRRRGDVGCKMCMKAEENSLAWYVKHHIELLIVAVRNNNTVPSENLTQTKEYKKKDDKKN